MIWFTGDVHGEVDVNKFSKERTKDLSLIEGDHIFIAGDFGFVWGKEFTKQERYWLDWLGDKGYIFLVVDGNHENFDRLFSDEFETVPMFGDEVKVISKNIYLMKRGHVYNVEDKKILTFGGGQSIDKARRMPGVSWWSQEIPNYEEEKTLFDNLEKHNNRVDAIVTHATHSTFYTKIFGNGSYKFNDPLHKTLEEVRKRTLYDIWACGHYHVFATSLETRSVCLYRDIVSYDDAKSILYMKIPGVAV